MPFTVPGTVFHPSPYVPSAKMPTDRTPQRPFAPWTEIAPTGSSILSLRSMKNTDSTTMMPEIRPMTQALNEPTNAHGAVMATKPASMPLHIMDVSGLLPRTFQIHIVAARAPVADASIVLTTLMALRRSVPARLEPGLKPNQPKARMNVPMTHIAMLCAGMTFGLPSLLYLPMRGPSIFANQNAMTPPCRCTTDEPAKSTVPWPRPSLAPSWEHQPPP